ncbi:MAG: hypothetical protein M1828_007448 [Chrysothrix sp. TS-e1954]|nr:MAG: hypothetical protein M1828_007448 [Chrysothrix sp. TS-e1954]
MSSTTTQLPASYYSKEDESYKVIISTAVGFALATLAICGRLVSRFLTRKRLEWNDYLILLAYIPKLGIDIASILLVHYGIGRHLGTLSAEQMRQYGQKFEQVLYVGSFLYAPTITLIKLSILSLYWSAFPSRWIHATTVALGGIIVAWGIACCLVGLLACLPIHKSWDPTTPGHCINLQHYYYGLQIPNIVTDFAILGLPFYPIWKLHLPTEKKVLMSGVMCIGLLTCIFDIIRLVVLVRLPNGGDAAWNQTNASVWTDLEPSVAILVACLPILRPLLHPLTFWRMRQNQSSVKYGSGAEAEEYHQMEGSPDHSSFSGPNSGYSDEGAMKATEAGHA